MAKSDHYSGVILCVNERAAAAPNTREPRGRDPFHRCRVSASQASRSASVASFAAASAASSASVTGSRRVKQRLGPYVHRSILLSAGLRLAPIVICALASTFARAVAHGLAYASDTQLCHFELIISF